MVCWHLINVTWKNCMLHAKIKEIKNGADTFSQHCRATLDFNLSHTMLRISLYNLTVPTTMLVALVCIYFFLFCTCFCFFLFVSFSSSHFSLFTFFFFFLAAVQDAQQLRSKQESYVREISDLQETLEWKEKKIAVF